MGTAVPEGSKERLKGQLLPCFSSVHIDNSPDVGSFTAGDYRAEARRNRHPSDDPPGETSGLDESDRLGRMVEEILLKQPEVVATARRTGRAEQDPHAQDVHASEIDVRLEMRERSKEALLADLRADLASVPGTNIIIGQPISHRIDHMLCGTRANIEVKIFRPDLYELRRLGEQVKTVADNVPGAVDVALEQQADIPFLTVKLKRRAIARHGLKVREVTEIIETAFVGQEVSRVLEGESSFDLVVRYAPSAKSDLEAVRSTLFTTARGARLPLHALAEIRKDREPNTISRENVQRKIVVMANVAGRDLQGVVDDIRRGIAAQVPMPTGYHVEFGGQFESAEQASQTLLILGLVVTVGIFLLLFVAFRSVRDALLVMLNLPLALIGGVVGVSMAGGVLSVASIIGFITLFGIATHKGVMLVAHIRNLVEKEGVQDRFEAVKSGATGRRHQTPAQRAPGGQGAGSSRRACRLPWNGKLAPGQIQRTDS